MINKVHPDSLMWQAANYAAEYAAKQCKERRAWDSAFVYVSVRDAVLRGLQRWQVFEDHFIVLSGTMYGVVWDKVWGCSGAVTRLILKEAKTWVNENRDKIEKTYRRAEIPALCVGLEERIAALGYLLASPNGEALLTLGALEEC